MCYLKNNHQTVIRNNYKKMYKLFQHYQHISLHYIFTLKLKNGNKVMRYLFLFENENKFNIN